MTASDRRLTRKEAILSLLFDEYLKQPVRRYQILVPIGDSAQWSRNKCKRPGCGGSQEPCNQGRNNRSKKKCTAVKVGLGQNAARSGEPVFVKPCRNHNQKCNKTDAHTEQRGINLCVMFQTSAPANGHYAIVGASSLLVINLETSARPDVEIQLPLDQIVLGQWRFSRNRKPGRFP